MYLTNPDEQYDAGLLSAAEYAACTNRLYAVELHSDIAPVTTLLAEGESAFSAIVDALRHQNIDISTITGITII